MGFDFVRFTEPLFSRGITERINQFHCRIDAQIRLDQQFLKLVEKLIIKGFSARKQLIYFSEYALKETHLATPTSVHNNRKRSKHFRFLFDYTD
jgi:hypothetical protein